MAIHKPWPNSPNIELTTYDQNTQTLDVTFKNLKMYRYSGVPVELWNELLQAPSIGKFFADKIKGKFSFVQI